MKSLRLSKREFMTNERFNTISTCVIVTLFFICVVASIFNDYRVQKSEKERTELVKEALDTGKPIVFVINERCLVEAVKDAENESN